MDACCAWNCDTGKFMTKFSATLSGGTTFHIRFVQKSTLFNSIFNHIHTHKTVANSKQMLDTATLLCEKF
jgi:hypothetical protein